MAIGEPDLSDDLLDRHMAALERLPMAQAFFDRTTRIDFALVEKGRQDLADELVVLEERLADLARGQGDAVQAPGGVGRLMAAAPDLRREFAQVLRRVLKALDHPRPDRFDSPVDIAPNLHLTPETRRSWEHLRQRSSSRPER